MTTFKQKLLFLKSFTFFKDNVFLVDPLKGPWQVQCIPPLVEIQVALLNLHYRLQKIYLENLKSRKSYGWLEPFLYKRQKLPFFFVHIARTVPMSISSIFDKCSILQQTQSRQNHTTYRIFHFNEFFANALCDNIGYKKQPLTSEKMRSFFSFK